MSKKTLFLLGIAITIILGTFLYVKFCCNCSPAARGAKKGSVVKDDNFTAFVLSGSGINYRTHHNIKFLKNSFAVIIPVSDSVTIGIENLKTYLLSNHNQKVTITGYATSDETNTTTFENLGLARANDIKNYFIAKGLPGAQFDTKGKIANSWKMSADTLLGPAEYNFATVDTILIVSDKWNDIKNKINTDPLMLHFNTNKSSDNLSNVEKQKVTEIAKYMGHVKNGAILIVGHTDNVGNRSANIALGQKRAEFSKNYLAKNGVDETRISTESKGPDEPIGENTTAEGKANNRRTVITIK